MNVHVSEHVRGVACAGDERGVEGAATWARELGRSCSTTYPHLRWRRLEALGEVQLLLREDHVTEALFRAVGMVWCVAVCGGVWWCGVGSGCEGVRVGWMCVRSREVVEREREG